MDGVVDAPALTRINPLMLDRYNDHGRYGYYHSFVTGWEVRKMKLDLQENGYCIKAVNSEAQPVLGLAMVELTLGMWAT
ncbi:hypothetical protein ACH5RR_036573 [Cinchona calisaya]|uniref:Uncharacterized protein n=1 Tax=Cinchona calisaya TaxID=153742 RepID=A0ABD2Y3M5_9GENT